MTRRVRTETPEQKDRRNERNRQRRAKATALRHEAAVAKVMERAAAAGKAATATSKAVEAPEQPTMTNGATKAPKTQPGAVEAPTAQPKAPTLDRRAAEWGFKAGVNGYLVDPSGETFFPFHPADLTHPQAMLHNDAAIRGRAMGALDELADFFATRVAGRMPSKAEMKLARLIESLAYELLAVADEIPRVLDRLDDLRRGVDQVRSERDQLKEDKRHTAGVMRQFIGQHVYIEDWPEA